ncbi:MAG: SulP family inorganic anion transporter, partial [Planctomycetia bacterium]
DSLMTAHAVGALAVLGTAAASEAAAALALLVAGAYVLFWLLRLDRLAALLGAPMLCGFMHAAALVIAASQAASLAGVRVAAGGTPLADVQAAAAALLHPHLATLAVGVGTIVLMVAWRALAERGARRAGLPAPAARALGKLAPLAGVLAAALACATLGAAVEGVALVGAVPAGLPTLSWPGVGLDAWAALAPTALAVAAVGFLEALSIARTLAARRLEHVAPRRELLALGAANAAAGLARGFPVTGGLSRSGVNHEAGAASGRASVVTAVLLAVALLLLSGAFAHVPRAALAAVVLVAVASLVDLAGFARAFASDWLEGLAAVGTLAAVLLAGVAEGMALGALLSCVVLAWRAPGGLRAALAAVLRPPAAASMVEPAGAGRLRVHGPLLLVHAAPLEEGLGAAIEAAAPGPLHVHVEAGTRVDATCREVLERCRARAAARGVDLRLPGP